MPSTVGIITPPWLTASGEPEMTEVDIEGEGAAARLAEASCMSLEEAESYLDWIAASKEQYLAEEQGPIGHA